jgi:uncharacterized protein YecE (DUF72 family)
MPTPYFFERVISKIKSKEGKFEFSIKAPSTFTHLRDYSQDDVRKFRESLIFLSNFLGCILFQFPHSFHLSKKNILYIDELSDRFADFPKIFEFRSSEWVNSEAFLLLKERDIGFCCVDEPAIHGLMPPIAVATSKIGYVRLHGRNAQKWYKHEKPEERYDYLYSEEELSEWKVKVSEISRGTDKVFVFFNNHPRAQAVKNALQFNQMLT